MIRRLLAGALAGVVLAGAVSWVSALAPGESLVRSRADGSQAQTFTATAGTECWRNGSWVIRPSSVSLSACTATTTTTVPATTSTTSTSTTTTVAPTTTVGGPVGVGFVETFTGNTGLERFDFGVYHRDEILVATRQWQGDHDAMCGDPTSSSRTVHRDTDEWVYACRDHLMTSIGDTAGYSTGWFTPRQTFTTERVVSWDVNVTDLMTRQWWEVAIVPASFVSGVPTCPQCAAFDFLSPDPSGLPKYPTGSVVVGNGPFGSDINIWHNRPRYSGWNTTCGQWGVFGDACSSKATRLTFTVTDSGAGMISVNYGGVFVETFPGSFPAGGFDVVFKDHNYTPDKDGVPVGHTWHWDNVVVK